MNTPSYEQGRAEGLAAGRRAAREKREMPPQQLKAIACPDTQDRREYEKGWAEWFGEGYEAESGCALAPDRIPPAPGGLSGGLPQGIITLHQAAAAHGTQAVKELLDAGADVNTRDGLGQTPLHAAAAADQTDTAALLLACGADVNARDANGRTPLHHAAGEGHSAVVEPLLDHGAEVHVRDRWGDTPLRSALRGGHPEIAALLRARPGAEDPEGSGAP